MQSTPSRTPRAAAISADTLAAGSTPPRPGLAPWLSLISSARTGAPATQILESLQIEPPFIVAAAEVGGADLEDQLAAMAMMIGDATLSAVVQTAGLCCPHV